MQQFAAMSTQNKNLAGFSGMPLVPRHSGPFYISNALFRNKRLKQKRRQWEAKYPYVQRPYVQLYSPAGASRHRNKTDSRAKRNRLANRQADITIDLLSDDDDEETDGAGAAVIHKSPVISAVASAGSLPSSTTQPLQHFLVLPPNYQLSDVPNITLIPVQKLPATRKDTNPPVNGLHANAKRKTRQPRRLNQAVIVNDESIVLTDEEDEPAEQQLKTHQLMPPHGEVELRPAIGEGAAIANGLHASPPTMKRQSTPKKSSSSSSGTRSSNLSTYHVTPTKISAHVDDEVTVSIVPRSSSGSCKAKPLADEAFPMLPDETTVHTVIANRKYELSLTKLREGLASCVSGEGDEEDGAPPHEESPPSPTKQRRKRQGSPAKRPAPPPAPIAIKLSSDLSISLISDDDDDEGEREATNNASYAIGGLPSGGNKLLERNRVAPLVVHSGADTRQVPRRRKLG